MLGKVIIYADDGTDRFGVNCLVRYLLDLLNGRYEVEAIRHIDVEPGYLCTPENRLFIMPGGADLPYCALLEPEGTDAIRQYVEEGGTYLGICAGAYFASRRVEFEEDRTYEVIGRRELRLAEVTARGVIRDLESGPYDPEHISGASAVRVKWGKQMATAYYHAGPEFVFDRPARDTEIVATYPDAPGSPPAVIRRRIGKGQAILCSPHFEIGAQDLREYRRPDPDDTARAQKVADALEAGGADPRAALARVLELAGLDLLVPA